MITQAIRAEFEESSLADIPPQDTAVIVPTVRATRHSRAGTHAYYFLNLRTRRALCVKIRHADIIRPGLGRLGQAMFGRRRPFAKLSLLFQRYHYGFNFLEQIMLMTVPHTVTAPADGRFIITLWSYVGYLEIDLTRRTVVYRILEDNGDHHVLGATQWYECASGLLYYMTYSLKDSLRKVVDPRTKVFGRILAGEPHAGQAAEIWSGDFSDYMHDLAVSNNKRYIVACEVGRFSDNEGRLIPSRALILDRDQKKEWIGSVVSNAAHAQFDPDDPDTVYFSNHNFQFIHTPLRELFKKGSYTLKFLGPASVHKVRLTSNGPRETGVFREPDLFRLTNFHVFRHRGRKILAAMGAPDLIFLADAEELALIKKIQVPMPVPGAYIGTIAPSHDGEKLYIQATRSFHVLDIESGRYDGVRRYEFSHTCSNHMMVSGDTGW